MFASRERNKGKFDSYSRQEQRIDHIPYYLSGLSRAHFSRLPFLNSCIRQLFTEVEATPM